MEAVGIAALVLLGLFLVAVAVAALRALPDLARYRRLRKM
jgi:hypothetical protein